MVITMNHTPTLSRLLSAGIALTLSFALLCGCTKEAETEKAQKMRDLTVTELVQEIKLGWNLGNTLDAHSDTLKSDKPTVYETSWGNPETTEEMILAVKDKGFNAVRVPITWTGHIGEAPDYTINDAWMDRVQVVVDYVVKNDLYCIMNLHHEDWHFPSYDNLDAAKSELTAVWKQIADRFKGYNEKLIFEGMNEPRMIDTAQEWTGGTPESRDVVNQLNAAFVETVRATAGNNEKRALMLPTYAASTTNAVLSEYKLPADDKLIVSVHAYTPYDFALNKNGTEQYNPDSDAGQIDNLMDTLDQVFVKKGHPVIIGEFGAMNKDNLDDRCAWAEYYVKAAKEKGIPCFWWDNGAFSGSGENFGLLNRTKCSWQFPELTDALQRGIGA